MTTGGKKDDSGKLRFDLLPVEPIVDLVGVLTSGAEHYGDFNWKKVKNLKNRYYAALCRHLFAWRQGELIDPQSGYPHLAHIMCNVVFLSADEKASVKKTLVKSQRKSGVQLQLRSSATEKKKIRRSCETPTRQYSEGFVTPPKESLPDLIGKVPHLLTNYGATHPYGGASFLPINYRCTSERRCSGKYANKYCLKTDTCSYKKQIKKPA